MDSRIVIPVVINYSYFAQIRPDDIAAELAAQLETFVNLTGYVARRVDGHNHVQVSFPCVS